MARKVNEDNLYTDEEICKIWRGSTRTRSQINILADLALYPVSEIESILKENGFEIPERKARQANQELRREVETLERKLVARAQQVKEYKALYKKALNEIEYLNNFVLSRKEMAQ